MKTPCYFATLPATKQKALKIQGQCNADNARVERRESYRAAKLSKASERVLSIWKNAGCVVLKMPARI